MRAKFEVTEEELRGLLAAHLREKLGDLEFTAKDVVIEVKSKQNYRSEWEVAAFRARLEVSHG